MENRVIQHGLDNLINPVLIRVLSNSIVPRENPLCYLALEIHRVNKLSCRKIPLSPYYKEKVSLGLNIKIKDYEEAIIQKRWESMTTEEQAKLQAEVEEEKLATRQPEVNPES